MPAFNEIGAMAAAFNTASAINSFKNALMNAISAAYFR